MYDVKYLLHQDRDEFVVPTTAEDWSSMIEDISAEWTAIQADRIASYSFRNRFFSLGFPDVVDKVLIVMTFAVASLGRWGGERTGHPPGGDTRMKKIVAEFTKNSGQTKSDR